MEKNLNLENLLNNIVYQKMSKFTKIVIIINLWPNNW